MTNQPKRSSDKRLVPDRLQSGEKSRPARSSKTPDETGPVSPVCPVSTRSRWVAAAVLSLGFVWSYWPTILSLVKAWETVPDYSHGFLVVPLAVYFAWLAAIRCRKPLQHCVGGV